MEVANVGFMGFAALMGFLGILIPIVFIIVAIVLIIGIFRIRAATEKIADRIEDIYKLLLQQKDE